MVKFTFMFQKPVFSGYSYLLQVNLKGRMLSMIKEKPIFNTMENINHFRQQLVGQIKSIRASLLYLQSRAELA